MSRSNYDKPFYVDVGTSIVAVRCASNHDVIVQYNHILCGKLAMDEVERICDRLNAEAQLSEERAVEHATRHAEAVARDNCRDCVHNPRGRNFEGGNAAAMREAAVTVYNSLEKLRPFSLHLGDVGRMREFSHLICLAKNRLDAALAVPPRNCDVYPTNDYAWRSYQLSHAWGKIVPDYIDWLFAPAAESETKGETDGR